MSYCTIFGCDYEGCERALGEDDVAQIHICVHPVPHDVIEPDVIALDLCPEHVDVVLSRILASPAA